MKLPVEKSQAMKSAKMKDTLVRPGKKSLKAAREPVLDADKFALEEDDHFMAPIFQDEIYKGTGAFQLVEWFDAEGSDEVFGGVRVMGASSRRLTALLVDYFELECLAVGASLACVGANDTIPIG